MDRSHGLMGSWRIAAVGVGLAMLCGLSLATPALAAGDAAENPYAILLESGTLVPQEGDLAPGAAWLAAQEGHAGRHMLVQLHEIPTAPEREALAGGGLRLLDYLPHRAWLASVAAGLSEAELRALGVRWLAPLELEQKASARVLTGEEAPWTEYEGGRVIYAIQMHADVSAEAGTALLARWSAVVGGHIRSVNAYIAALDPADIFALALEDEVQWVDLRPPVLTAVNDGIRQAIGVNTLQGAPYDLDGTGANILVYDGGLVGTHPDFGARVTHGEYGGVSNHGTHVAGTVGGDGANSGGTYAGMAPNTRITSYLYESCSPYCLYNSPQDIEENYEEGLWSFGANLATNSLGSNIAPNGYDCAWEGDYELTAQLLDAICRGSLGRPFLSCWAAGNERHYGRCGTGYFTTGVPATAKNIIAVGATMSNDHSMSWFSSWGPVDDGRIRPDVCAPGCQSGGDGGITSTLPGGGYGAMCGTSMATPAVAGCLALIIQQYRQVVGGLAMPLPSTFKALLINTAQDYYNVGPDYQFGYGEIRPQAAVDALINGLARVEEEIGQGDGHQYRFEVAAPMTELKATVAWSDYPGTPLAQIELVNDLDVYFESPSGGTHYPWILNPQVPDNAATRGPDHLNPVEQVLVSNPEQGVWTLHVAGTAVPQGPQSYSLVANLPLYTGSSSAGDGDLAVARGGVVLLSNQPNPFAAATAIRYAGAQAGASIAMEIRDVTGRAVRTLRGTSAGDGVQELTWDGRDAAGRPLPAGVYFCGVAGREAAAASGEATGNAPGQRLLLLR